MSRTNRRGFGVLLAGTMSLAIAAVAMSVGGCQTDESSMTDFFPPDQARASQQFVAAQAASGARADATLQPSHFDGDRLSSLGEDKLELMLMDDDTAEPLVVYLNLDKDAPNLNVRREAVTEFFIERGLLREQIELRTGSNPNVTSLTAKHLARMHLTDSGGSDGESPAATDASSDADRGTMSSNPK